MAEALIQGRGGLRGCDLGTINHQLNRTPMSRLQMASPLDRTRPCSGRRTCGPSETLACAAKKRPGRMNIDAVQIQRQGDTAILTPHDPGQAVAHFRLGPELGRMSDEEILASFNETIDARDRLEISHPYVATEVPPGRPQTAISGKRPVGAAWQCRAVPRGER